MSTVFIIGSNSFSGASYAEFVLEQEAKVIGISRSPEPADAFLPYKWHEHGNFAFHQLDLNRNLPEIMALVKKVEPEYVVNFAAQSMVAESWRNPGDWFMTNA